MNVLIVYGTTEGQARKIANFMADHLRERSETVMLIDSNDVPKGLDVEGFDAAIAAGSVHNGRHQAMLFQFARDRFSRSSLRLQDTDDLLFAEPAALHIRRLQIGGGLSVKMVEMQETRSACRFARS